MHIDFFFANRDTNSLLLFYFINAIENKKRSKLLLERICSAGTYHPRRGIVLQLLRVVGLDGLRLDDDGGVAAGEGSAFGSDGAGDIARGESQCHRDGGGDGYNEVLNGLPHTRVVTE